MSLPRTTQRECQPIGRVLSQGDRRFPPRSLLCQGDRLNLPPWGKVEVLCFFNRRVLPLSAGIVSSAGRCVPKELRAKHCSVADRSRCPKPKGAGEIATIPVVIEPYSNVLLEGRPFLSWAAVVGATNYSVEVRGPGVHWQKLIEGTTLPYPQEQPAMAYGSAYQVAIIAYQNNSPLSASRSAFNLLPERDVRQITQAVEKINSLDLPKDEAAYLDLDSLYMGKNLLSATINMLEAQVREGSLNPGVYRVLGDRYLEAGLPTEAKSHYERAAELATKADNPSELQRAQDGLKAILTLNQPKQRL